MVGSTIQQQQQQLSRTSTAQTTTPEEDELLKRNTDCVYFLASPLTCKKGSECEYRHSDIARVNPRDCWYWLNGNCLNPKCAFRHPPLDGLLGSDVSTPVGVSASHSTPYAMPKQGVACIFFQKGYCLKGHLCPFLHGPSNSVNNKPTQPGPANPVPEPPKMAQQVTDHKPVEFQPSQGKQPALPNRNGVDKKTTPPACVVPPPVMNEPPSNKPNHGNVYPGYHATNNERTVNGKDADEYSREPSPGFDVLVDTEDVLVDTEREHAGHDYDVDHVNRGMYRDHRDYDHYNERDGHFDVDHVNHLDRMSYPRNGQENESDLRHRLSKQRRGSDNGLRSVVKRESHADRMTRRDSHRSDQGTLGSRLRGRIKIQGRSTSPTKENNSRVEREIYMERRHLSRHSPGRPHSVDHSRVRDRVRDSKFAGPKRLSELKSVRTEHQSNEEQFLGKRKYPKMEENLSFEGPKPLSEILKRKRGINDNTVTNNNRISSVNIENKKETEIIHANKEEHNSVSGDFETENEKDKQADVDSVSYGANEMENEGEGGLVDEDALLDEELEGYDENIDGDYEYEQMDGEEDYNFDEGEYVDEDGDEYGNKEDVVYS